jgi:glycosyltransferase involved in cell wall biosynthesis
MKEVFIISTAQIINARTAGSQRVLNIAGSLAAGGVQVFIASLHDINDNPVESVKLSPGIHHLKSRNKKEGCSTYLRKYIASVNSFIKKRDSEKVLYLYPTVFIFRDFVYLFYFKMLGYKVYCDINELRATNAFTYSPPERFFQKFYFLLKAMYEFISYKLSELQVPFYDGIVVISTSLERYFKRLNKRILRIPILCDVAKVKDGQHAAGPSDSAFKICFAGFINCRKEGFDTLFEALHEVNIEKHVELYLYGILIEQEEQAINYLAEKFQLRDRVYYKGNIDPEDLSEEFKKYHLLILPRPLRKQAQYGFSTKLSEYLTSGVPVLLTDVSDNAMYIRDNYNGFIISPNSLSALVSKLKWIIDNYDEYASVVTENAVRTAEEVFDYRIYSEPLVNFLFKKEAV